MEFLAKRISAHVNKLLINSVSCVNAAAQFAGIAALDGPDDSINEMMVKFTERRKLIHEGLNSLPGVECSLPGGAFYAFPKVIGTGMNGKEFAGFIPSTEGYYLAQSKQFILTMENQSNLWISVTKSAQSAN